jgi:flagellar motility protein MotE (MotC chaperone)
MNLKMKDFIAIAVATVATFPVLYLVMLFVTGAARIEFQRPKDDGEKKQKVEMVKQSARKDSLALQNSKTFQALQLERAELEQERQRMREQQDRINLLQSEVEQERKLLSEERHKFENVVQKSDSLGSKKIKDLAKMYAAMRPSEATSILSTLDDRMVAKVLKAISDDRQKAKILGALSTDKAARISRIIGAP